MDAFDECKRVACCLVSLLVNVWMPLSHPYNAHIRDMIGMIVILHVVVFDVHVCSSKGISNRKSHFSLQNAVKLKNAVIHLQLNSILPPFAKVTVVLFFRVFLRQVR
ncbi:hypothetical protein KFK09_010827 [Dendrobium nobile]|uniref:Uncharacterized protein n=1 Tax=Dendrobium nobile TaxID=94219 RepID=A0A8T3BB43_DENNO|nr:hypothetical protein KFK09_010827 [Dendrobium nobile]